MIHDDIDRFIKNEKNRGKERDALMEKPRFAMQPKVCWPWAGLFIKLGILLVIPQNNSKRPQIHFRFERRY